MLGELRPGQYGTTAGLWHLNGNYNDFSGNDRHLTGVNSPTFVQGRFGSAMNIVSASGQIASASTFPAITDNISIILWTKRANSGVYGVLVARDNYTDNRFSFQLAFNLDKIRFSFDAHANGLSATVQDTISSYSSTTEWYNIGVSMSGGTVAIYVNGDPAPLATKTGTDTTMNSNTGPITLGCQNYPAAIEAPYSGIIDEVAVITRNPVLTPVEFKKYYAISRGKYY